jgi:predicted aspartyl protease
MMRGTVNSAMEAVLRLRLRGPGGRTRTIHAVLDTGFTASLTLPIRIVNELLLERESMGSAELADGTISPFDLYNVEVRWNNTWKPILAWAIGDDVLAGMGLVADCRVTFVATPGGETLIENVT